MPIGLRLALTLLVDGCFAVGLLYCLPRVIRDAKKDFKEVFGKEETNDAI